MPHLILSFLFTGIFVYAGEQFPAKDYIKFTESQPIPDELIQWSDSSGKVIFYDKGKRPYLLLEGISREGLPLMINSQRVTDSSGKFKYEVELPSDPAPVIFRVLTRNLQMETYTRTYFWAKVPPSIRVKIREGDQIVSKEKGVIESLKYKAFCQLVSNRTPTNRVDLDTARQANFGFMISYPQEAGENYDSWALIIRDSQKRLVADIKRYDNPPTMLSFGEVAENIVLPGIYTYRVDLLKPDRVIEGTESTFEAVASQSVSKPTHPALFALEPKQEFGYYSYKNLNSFSTSGMYVAADLTGVISGVFLAQARGQFALPTANPNDFLSTLHLGVGYRMYFSSANLDLLFKYSHYSVSPASPVTGFSHITLGLEPHFIIWNEGYLTPLLEFGVGSDQKRLATGAIYQLFIRPWSARIGAGLAYDILFNYTPDPAMKFTLFRVLAQMTFVL